MNRKIAYLGPDGSFGSEALERYFPGQIEQFGLPCGSNLGIVEAVAGGEAMWGVLPIENSSEGGGAEFNNIAALRRKRDLNIPLWAHAMVTQPVKQCFIGQPNTDLATVRRVLTHPNAYRQCQGNIAKYIGAPMFDERKGTSQAVSEVVASIDPTIIAIGSARAAQIHGGAILLDRAEDDQSNETLFLVISNQQTPEPRDTDAVFGSFVIFSCPNVPGGLVKALNVLAQNELNMVLEVSCSAGKQNGHRAYYFCTIFEGADYERHMVAIAEMRQKCDWLHHFGTFPV